MIVMLVLFRDSEHLAPPLLPPPTPGPDYAALVDILIDLQPPDNAGEIIINAEEAARLRAAGWSARKGLWRSPAIPPEFLALYPPLWHLRDDIDPASRTMPWHPRRAVFHRPGLTDPLGAVDHQLLDQLLAAPGGRLTAQQLRHRLSWRIPARLADFMLNRLAEENYITVAPDGYICLRAGS